MTLRERLEAGSPKPERIVMVPLEEWREALAATADPAKPRHRRTVTELKLGAERAVGLATQVGIQANHVKLVLDHLPADWSFED